MEKAENENVNKKKRRAANVTIHACKFGEQKLINLLACTHSVYNIAFIFGFMLGCQLHRLS